MNIRVQNEDEIKKTKKPLFTLTRKNQKGQVAIFVALIFQIVFIFFALLINVGLLVHHKINLQQSTDLAAYYGAMKQAEMLNVVAHVNFQIRQAWKLLTWRYRILGTFGFTQLSNSGSNFIDLPINDISSSIKFSNLNTKCGPPANVNLNDVPAFCLAHVGYADWSAPPAGSETYCKIGCNTVNTGIVQSFNKITGVGSFSWGGATVGGAINTAINNANQSIVEKCTNATVIGSSVLAKFVDAYSKDLKNKKDTIQFLLSNLTSSSDKFVDLDGKLVSLGVKNTFLNNLTDANKSSTFDTLQFLNSTSEDFSAGADCGYKYGSTNTELVSEVIFKYVIFYLLACESPNGTTKFSLAPIVDNNGLNLIIKRQLETSGQDPTTIQNIFAQEFSLGYEKNPWCQNYYGVRATAEPKIPFLPISKIKLSAVSFAKPFGGSIGPMFYNKWESTQSTSDRINGDISNQTDKVLPLRNPAAAATSLSNSSKVNLNFSNYVGDTLGLANHEYIGIYHDYLIANQKLGLGSERPAFVNWSKAGEAVDSNNYNPLASGININLRIRNLEISAIAPNQFDLSYYSIDSDFYNNYYNEKLDNSAGLIDKLKSLSNFSGTHVVTQDYGYDKSTNLNYSVSKQLEVVEKIIRPLLPNANPASDEGRKFTFIPASPASLLTGWTFLNLTNADGYKNFPDEASGTTMPFGTCKDSGKANEDYRSIVDPNANPKLPPTPGNCVSGGRTGYSVKIVSQEAINGKQKGIGGPGTEGQIRNPIPDTFLNF